MNELAAVIQNVARKRVTIRHVPGPVGVQSRNFSNEKIYSVGWQPRTSLHAGIGHTYRWIDRQVKEHRPRKAAAVV